MDGSFPSKSDSTTFSELFEDLSCSMMFCEAIKGLNVKGSVSNRLLSKNDDEVVVVLEEVVSLSTWSSSDERSRLFAKGTESRSSDGTFASTS